MKKLIKQIVLETIDVINEAPMLDRESYLDEVIDSYFADDPITEDKLLKTGFKKDCNNDYWVDITSNYLKLIKMGVNWYPVFCEPPELSSEQEQCVSLRCIRSMIELNVLINVLIEV